MNCAVHVLKRARADNLADRADRARARHYMEDVHVDPSYNLHSMLQASAADLPWRYDETFAYKLYHTSWANRLFNQSANNNALSQNAAI